MSNRDLSFVLVLSAAVVLAEIVAFAIGDLALVILLAAITDLVLRRIEDTRARPAHRIEVDDPGK